VQSSFLGEVKVWGLELRVWALGFSVFRGKFRVEGLGLRV